MPVREPLMGRGRGRADYGHRRTSGSSDELPGSPSRGGGHAERLRSRADWAAATGQELAGVVDDARGGRDGAAHWGILCVGGGRPHRRRRPQRPTGCAGKCCRGCRRPPLERRWPVCSGPGGRVGRAAGVGGKEFAHGGIDAVVVEEGGGWVPSGGGYVGVYKEQLEASDTSTDAFADARADARADACADTGDGDGGERRRVPGRWRGL